MEIRYAKDKRNDGAYNVRCVGPGAHDQEGQTVHVRTAAGQDKPETLGRRIWAGQADDGQDAALYAKGGNNGTRQSAPADEVASLRRRVEVLERQVAELMGKPARPAVDPARRAAERAASSAAMRAESVPDGPATDDDLPF